jgi:hypothetical protein
VLSHTSSSRVAPTTINVIAHDPTGAMALSHTPAPMLGGASPKANYP